MPSSSVPPRAPFRAYVLIRNWKNLLVLVAFHAFRVGSNINCRIVHAFANSLVFEAFLGFDRAYLSGFWDFSTADLAGSFLRKKDNTLYYKQSKNGAKESLLPSDEKP